MQGTTIAVVLGCGGLSAVDKVIKDSSWLGAQDGVLKVESGVRNLKDGTQQSVIIVTKLLPPHPKSHLSMTTTESLQKCSRLNFRHTQRSH